MTGMYITAILGVLLIELQYYSKRQKKWANFASYWNDRWDDFAISFLAAIMLCIAAPELAELCVEFLGFSLVGFPIVTGLIIGLGSTKIVQMIVKRISDKTNEKEA